MREDATVETKDGLVKYTVYSCDWCEIKTLDPVHWLYVATFFQEYRYLFHEWSEFENNFGKLACSTQCLESLLKDAFFLFYRKFNAKVSETI